MNLRPAILLLCLLTASCARFPPVSPETLVLHYDFEKGAPARAVDRSGTGNHGSLKGDPVPVRGITGRALRFDGVRDYIRVPRDPSLEPDELTVAAWVKVNGFREDFALLVQKRNPSLHNNEDYNLQFWPDGTIRMVVANGVQSRVDSMTPIGTGTWHHVAMVFSEPEMRLYLDGTLTGFKEHARPLSHHPGSDLLICAAGHAHYPMALFMACDLDELWLYRSALSDADIAALYAPKADRLPEIARPERQTSLWTPEDENAPIRPAGLPRK